MSKYFSKPKSLGRDMKVEWDLSSYATKANLRNVSGVDRSNFAKKVTLASLKLEIDKLDIIN